jgi:hypothetical protein
MPGFSFRKELFLCALGYPLRLPLDFVHFFGRSDVKCHKIYRHILKLRARHQKDALLTSQHLPKHYLYVLQLWSKVDNLLFFKG